MKKGIIFDVDGTLWDACSVIADSWNEYIRGSEPDLEANLTYDDLHRTCGLTMTAIADTLFPQLQTERRYDLLEKLCSYEVDYLRSHDGEIYPHVKEIMASLSGPYHLYIVSNCQRGYVQRFIDQAGCGSYIEDYEEYGRTGLVKDRNIELLVGRNHLETAVYVGDTQGDYNSTRMAGQKFIHAAYGFGTLDETSVPDGVIHSLDELPECVRQVLAE